MRRSGATSGFIAAILRNHERGMTRRHGVAQRRPQPRGYGAACRPFARAPRCINMMIYMARKSAMSHRITAVARALALALPVALASQLVWGAPTADQAYERVAQRYMNEVLALDPVDATQLGDHRFDSRTNDESPAGRAKMIAVSRSLLTQLDQVDTAQLS